MKTLIGKHVYAGEGLNGIYGTIVGRRIDVDGFVWYDVKDDETGAIREFANTEVFY
jgi:hypothetical protein